jgi:hypothetical protein
MPQVAHSQQSDLFDYRPIRFDGWLYREVLDRARLTTQLRRVCFALLDGRWWTLKALALEVNGSVTGVSARLRDLRKPRFGGFTVQNRRRPGAEDSGVWEYRLNAVRPEQVDAIFGGTP